MVNNSGIGEEGGPDDGLWAPGVDYVAGWTAARTAAEAMNAAAAECGLAGHVRAMPHARADGEPVVWLCADGASRIAETLTLWARGGQTDAGDS
ncbi:hypothetical protein AB0I84_32905 [Streptomyces spectabilis]|uniref:hypothetical protein n=1 Tax=Streptomyces spectabilis TaxID=68270 RepID=UPI00340B2361